MGIVHVGSFQLIWVSAAPGGPARVQGYAGELESQGGCLVLHESRAVLTLPELPLP